MRQFSDGWNNPHLWLLAFCGGVVALRFFERLPALPGVIVALALLVLCAVRWRWLRPGAAFLIGFCWAVITATTVSNTTLPAAAEKQDVVISGRVVGVPVASGERQRFDFKVERFEWRGRAHPPPGKIRLKLYQAQPLIRSGERWRFTARLKRARGYNNPGAPFNYETHLFHHRLRATGYVRAQPPPLLLAPQPAHSIAAFRARVAGFIRATLPDAGRAGLVTALVVGIRSDMTATDWEVLVRTGTIHLVAISGLHIGLVSGLALLLGGCCWRLAGRLPLWLPAPKAGVLAGLLTGITYALLAGMTIPTQRAVCMLAVVAAALFFQRRPFGWETLVMALAAVLAVDPLAPLAGGLWLSFGAVVILIIGAQRARTSARTQSLPAVNSFALANHPRHPPKPPNALRQLLAKLGAWWLIQLMLLVGMAPLLLALFHQFSLSAPLANLAAIPLIGLVAVPAGLLGLLLYAIGLEPAAALAFHASLWVIDHLWVLLEWLSAGGWSVWRQPSPPLWSLPPAAVGVLLLLSPRVVPARWTGLLWLLPLFSTAPATLAPGEFKYTLLEVGHGLASVVQTRNHLLLYDAGPSFPGGFDTGESIVVPFLQQLGANRIDTVIVSHGDNDHSGGHRAVLARFAAGRVLTSVPALIPKSQPCEAGQRWTWDDVNFQMLSPPPPSLSPLRARAHGNEASCVLKVASAFGSLLLTGDIGKPTEARLLESGFNIQADVLQTPHHGSKTSSTAAFLERVQPAVSLNSIGYLNRYHHPNRKVAQRYAQRKIPLYNTAEEGAITATFTATGITLQSHRASDKKYWLHPAKQLTKPHYLSSLRHSPPLRHSRTVEK